MSQSVVFFFVFVFFFCGDKQLDRIVCCDQDDSFCMFILSLILQLIKSKYFPPFESVMQLCWKRCSGVVGKTLDPMDPNYIPPLSIQEALIVSLVLNIQQLRPDMSGLLYTILNSFKEAILSPNTDFHSKCALWYVFLLNWE